MTFHIYIYIYWDFFHHPKWRSLTHSMRPWFFRGVGQPGQPDLGWLARRAGCWCACWSWECHAWGIPVTRPGQVWPAVPADHQRCGWIWWYIPSTNHTWRDFCWDTFWICMNYGIFSDSRPDEWMWRHIREGLPKTVWHLKQDIETMGTWSSQEVCIVCFFLIFFRQTLSIPELVIHPVLRGNDAAGSLRVWHLLFEVNSTSVFHKPYLWHEKKYPVIYPIIYPMMYIITYAITKSHKTYPMTYPMISYDISILNIP